MAVFGFLVDPRILFSITIDFSRGELSGRTIPDLALCIQTPLHRGVAANPGPSTKSDSDEARRLRPFQLTEEHIVWSAQALSEFLALSEHPPSLPPPASGVRPEHALRYGPGDPVDPAGATCRRIKPREHRLTCAQAWAARLDKGRADIDSQTAVDPAWEEHLARGPVDEHEAICRSSAVLRCIAAGRSASVCEGHNAGEQVVSNTILTSGPHQRSRSHLVQISPIESDQADSEVEILQKIGLWILFTANVQFSVENTVRSDLAVLPEYLVRQEMRASICDAWAMDVSYCPPTA
ncbi:hypothetical protein LA080_008610 [Diaporthe eres]|nr:hypothetical protein LA080_008610 [Diaporthe eres]